MNSPDYMVAETDIQSFWTSFKVFEPYSTILLTSLFMIPVTHIIVFLGYKYAFQFGPRPSELILLQVIFLIL